MLRVSWLCVGRLRKLFVLDAGFGHERASDVAAFPVLAAQAEWHNLICSKGVQSLCSRTLMLVYYYV